MLWGKVSDVVPSLLQSWVLEEELEFMKGFGRIKGHLPGVPGVLFNSSRGGAVGGVTPWVTKNNVSWMLVQIAGV